jgi:hypothetical protein
MERLEKAGQGAGSPSLGRLCPGSGNLSSGRLVLACALLQVVIPPVPLVFSTVLES